MIDVKKILDKRNFFYLLLVIYFVINLAFLTKFPFVHSDESWLSGLSRNIMENKDYSVTETFFDLYERNPHAIKSIFHTIQIAFIKIFGYSIFSVRMISLVFSTLSLLYFYRLCKLFFKSDKIAFITTVFLSLDVQFIYASHFARQEIIILFTLILAFYYLFKHLDSFCTKDNIILGLIIGLSIGIHPNSFIISLPIVLIYLYNIFITKKLNFRDFFIFGVVLALFAALFVALSLYFDANFFYNYSKYGEQFGVFYTASSKLSQIKNFYMKLYYSVSGTYYTPNIKFQFLLFSVALITSLIKLYKLKEESLKEKIIAIILSIIAINIGTIIIGRYNQTSIVFQFPLFYVLVVYMFSEINNSYKRGISIVISLILLGSSVYNAIPYTYNDYNDYLNQISKIVNKNDMVLANLNCEFYFNNGKLLDYRNLSFLKKHNIAFEEYIYNNNIEYIIYPEEMDFIYNSRPVWNGIYGNTYYYYDDMKHFMKNKCELVYEFNDNTYAIRIARYINKRDWNVKIFKILHKP
ncbi:ArnT family glycosyltransferase [Wukongibacter sp. M2B1]|uniref:ArnT family glycosyltransferase n=1 Tax=Wukongibacter sp. M2B1 TaxID=3088895 RepID=UPI003D7B31B0